VVLALCRCLRKEEYYTCLVDIGANEEPFGDATTGYIDKEYRCKKNSDFDSEESYNCDKMGGIDEGRHDPLRYVQGMRSLAIQTFEREIEQLKLQMEPTNSYRHLRGEFEKFFCSTPKQDVLEAVRGLFLRNLINIDQSRVGYGDFLMLCDFEVTALDPLLFR
jgi:hypothetical protein